MDEEVIRVFMVDDDEDDYVLTRDLLAEAEGARFELERVDTYQAALEAMGRAEHDVYLVDYLLGERDGLELLRAAIASGCRAPIIILTGRGDHAVDVAAMKAGAADYLDKGELSAPLLERSIRYAIERFLAEEALRESEERLRAIFESAQDAIFTKDLEGRYTRVNAACASLFGLTLDEMRGQTDFDLFPPEVARHTQEIDRAVLGRGEATLIEDTKPIADARHTFHVSKVPLRDASGNIVGLAGIARDITERVRMEEQLAYMATHDALTGLPNRRLFNDRLNVALAHAYRYQQKLAVMLLDLDYFKDVNDTLGHSVGDQLLQAVGERLTSLLRQSDTVARMGGDEFMLIIPEVAQAEDAAQVAQKILEAIREPFEFDDRRIRTTTSIGIALCPEDGADVDILMRNADIAMYRAKDRGRDNVQRYAGA
jgi:diguanylate cyclase (GGDEF)-like protein/PAS domain S-box-containing protein